MLSVTLGLEGQAIIPVGVLDPVWVEFSGVALVVGKSHDSLGFGSHWGQDWSAADGVWNLETLLCVDEWATGQDETLHLHNREWGVCGCRSAGSAHLRTDRHQDIGCAPPHLQHSFVGSPPSTQQEEWSPLPFESAEHMGVSLYPLSSKTTTTERTTLIGVVDWWGTGATQPSTRWTTYGDVDDKQVGVNWVDKVGAHTMQQTCQVDLWFIDVVTIHLMPTKKKENF